MTWWHQVITIIAIPIALAMAGWFASEFDSQRINSVHMQDHLAAIDSRLNSQSDQLTKIWDKLIGAHAP